jgi:hypothetical protein
MVAAILRGSHEPAVVRVAEAIVVLGLEQQVAHVRMRVRRREPERRVLRRLPHARHAFQRRQLARECRVRPALAKRVHVARAVVHHEARVCRSAEGAQMDVHADLALCCQEPMIGHDRDRRVPVEGVAGQRRQEAPDEPVDVLDRPVRFR